MAKWKKQYLRAFCAAMLVIMTFVFCVGCAGEKKYDVSIKVVNNYGDEWIFTPDVDELYYEFRYTGEGNDIRGRFILCLRRAAVRG